MEKVKKLVKCDRCGGRGFYAVGSQSDAGKPAVMWLCQIVKIRGGFIMDLNKANGSFKQPKDLTDEEREIIRELIYNYRDNLAGGNDEYFDQMQAILEKLR